ncbi:hypothetical protein SteCoe_13359 [Stentor coeruleus]|uniref:RAP domain-containing protein n=1 Tax=Stentor coeruleus TaxID=5963 RepID=A0A1R2C8K4_9CILI|nr:hypothetical protein SteCoe_13359 [Stentor coeruleus]
MKSLVPQFAELMKSEDFIKYFGGCCKKISVNGINNESKQIYDSLLRNYKEHAKIYNESSVLVNALIFWTNKFKINNKEIENLLKEGALLNLTKTEGKNIIITANAFCRDGEFLKRIEEHMMINLKKYDSRTLSQVASIIKSPGLVSKLKVDNKLNVSNDFDLVYFLKNTEETQILDELQKIFKELLPNIVSARNLVTILYEYSKKNYTLRSDILNLVETAILRPSINLNLEDVHYFLIFANHSTVYSRLSLPFWNNFTEKLIRSINLEWSAATTMNYLSQEGFFIDRVYKILTENWKIQFEQSKDVKILREGFIALSNSWCFSQEVLDWTLERFLKYLDKFEEFDLLHIARSLTIQGIYRNDFWTPLVAKLKFINPNKLSSAGKSVAYHICKSIEIDMAENYKENLTNLHSLLSESHHSYKNNAKFTKTYSQKYIARILSLYEYNFLENQYISEFYEIDLLIPDKNLIIEVLGKPYHFSQFSNKFYPKLLMKIRHLNKLGYKVILVNDKETAEELLHKTIIFTDTFSHPLTINLLSGEIKFLNSSTN